MQYNASQSIKQNDYVKYKSCEMEQQLMVVIAWLIHYT